MTRMFYDDFIKDIYPLNENKYIYIDKSNNVCICNIKVNDDKLESSTFLTFKNIQFIISDVFNKESFFAIENLEKFFILKYYIKDSIKNRTNIKININKRENNKSKYPNFLNNNKSYNTIAYSKNRQKVLKSNSNKFTFTNYKNNDLTDNNYLTNDFDNNSSRINYSTNRKKENNSLEVNNIVNSLISPGNKTLTRAKISKQRQKFPKERSIDPISYIKYNLQNNPNDKNLYKGINKVMKQLGRSYMKDEYESNLIKKASDVNYLKIDNEHIQAPLGEAQKYKQKYEDLIDQTKIFKAFYFNKNETPQKKEKIKYNPHRKVLDKIYKIYFDNKVGSNDEKKKEEADLKNEAEQLVFQTERSIKDLGDKIDSKDKEKAEAEIKDLKEALEKNDLDDIKSKKEKLQETAMAFATKVYEEAAKANQANQESSESSSDKKDDGVEEAEFEEK